MLFETYELYRRRYLVAKQAYEELLTKREQFFTQTQPQSVRYDREQVTGGPPENRIEAYIVRKEEWFLDERIEEARGNLEEREAFLRQQERELRESRDILDRIYVLRYLDRSSAIRIQKEIGYSQAQVYRFLDKIRKKICEI